MDILVETQSSLPSERHWSLFAYDFLFTLDLIEQFVNVHTVETFVQDDPTVQAVTENLRYISTISKEIPLAIRWKFSEVPWAILRNLDLFISGRAKEENERMIWSMTHAKVLPLRDVIRHMLEESERTFSTVS